jgi:SAM-dependent methyltransferase
LHAVEPENRMSFFIDSLSRIKKNVPIPRTRDQAIEQQLREIIKQNSDLRARLVKLETILRRTESEVKSLRLAIEPPDAVLTGDANTWKQTAQPGELAFHKSKNIRSGAQWVSGNKVFWRNQGFSPKGWEGKVIVDVGAGSRLRTLFFKGAHIVAIEPLAQEFLKEVEWQDLDKAAEIHASPAEVLIPGLVGRADLIVSVNALDHGFEFERAIQNLRQYIKPEGLVYLSYDQHEKPDEMHPLILNDKISRGVFERSGFRVAKAKEKSRYHGGDAGPNALCYWLKPV